MIDLDQDLESVKQYFPGFAREFELLIESDDDFRSICRDLVDAEVAATKWGSSSTAESEQRRLEYLGLIDDLKSEIKDRLLTSRVVPFRPPKPRAPE